MLMQGKLNKGYAILMDNKTYCTGTLNKKRLGDPNVVIAKKLKWGINISRYPNGTHVGKYQDKMELMYI